MIRKSIKKFDLKSSTKINESSEEISEEKEIVFDEQKVNILKYIFFLNNIIFHFLHRLSF